ncbi:MAG TPA: DUF1015 domain-containing protein [Polyangiaceae bacterium]
MAEIAPLTPLRFDAPLESVICPPYDVISEDERKALLARDPRNVVRLELPEGEGDAKYANAAALLAEWTKSGVLARDNEPAFYRYDQSFRSITRRGFFAAVRLHPFSDRIVLPHERTLSGPKEDRLKLFRATRAQVSPGFMLYADPRGTLDAPLETGSVYAEFATPDGIHHAVAKVTARDAIAAIVDGLRKSTLLIADGHHRYETTVAYSQEVGGGEDAESRFFMTFLVNGDDPNLVVYPTHRLIHSLPQFDYEALLEKAQPFFIVMRRDDEPTAETLLEWLAKEAPTAFVVASGKNAALLVAKKNVDLASHPTLGALHPALRATDVAMLHSGVLEHLLGISKEAQAAKTNIRYPQDARAALAELRARKGNAQALFLMNATPVAQVRAVAEAGEVMPQKSTFFHPKVPTGIVLHTLDPSRSIPR